jgi:tRNA threonylcarbamoyladenosine biosynthesis protein TsaB
MTELCLALETTGTHLGLALLDMRTGRRKAGFFADKPYQQSDLLFPTLDKLLKRAKVARSQVGLIAVDSGPGSFTGVRIGVVSARALAQALDRPLVGVASLEAVAWSVAQQNSAAGPLVVVMPALPGEIYLAVYDVSPGTVKERVPPRWLILEEAARQLAAEPAGRNGTVVLTRDDSAIAAGLRLPAGYRWAAKPVAPHPDAIASLAVQRYQASNEKKMFAYENTFPVYLLPSWAERRKPGSSVKGPDRR